MQPQYLAKNWPKLTNIMHVWNKNEKVSEGQMQLKSKTLYVQLGVKIIIHCISQSLLIGS